MKIICLSLSSALLLLVAGCQTAPRVSAVPLPEESPAPPPPPSAAPSIPSIAPSAAAAVTTASGLRYQVIASGPANGRSPTVSDSVKVHYTGTLTNGTVFDSSIGRSEPATFGVGQVIPGWTEALQLMKPGDKWTIHIPSRLAYGSRAMGPYIPANSDLIFQVELLEVLGGR